MADLVHEHAGCCEDSWVVDEEIVSKPCCYERPIEDGMAADVDAGLVG